MVSKCCRAAYFAHHGEDCSYYVCAKCQLPTDGVPDAEFQCAEQAKVTDLP